MDSPRKRKFIQYLTECIDQYIKEEDSLKKFKITRSNTELSITENSVKIELRPFNPENALDKLMAQSKAQAIVQKARKVKEEESAKKENMTEVVQENKPDEENIQEIQFEKHNEDHEQSTPQANDNVDTKGESPSFNRSNTYHKYSQEEKRKIIECHIAYGKEYTLVKYGIKEGTLNSLITKYNKLGEDAFKDLRSQNGRNPYTALDERLLAYIKGRRELYLPITLAMLTKEALRLNTDATFLASKGWRTNFLTRNKLAVRKRTQKVKNLMLDYHKKAENYFSVLRDIHLHDGNDVLSLPFDLGGSYTIEEQGVSQVPITTHNKSKETCAISSGVTSDGEIILSIIIFKYKSTGKKKREAPKKFAHWTRLTHPCMTKFTESGFNNIKIMKEWVEELKKKLKDEKRKVILLLDTAPCHQEKEIQKLLKNTKIELLFIPGGCTSFLQPLDVTLNKKVKQKIQESYFGWLDSLESRIREDIAESQNNVLTKVGNLRAPSLEQIREWTWKSYKGLTSSDIINSFAFSGVTEDLCQNSTLNRQLKANLRSLIEQFEEEAVRDEYLDAFEQDMIYTLNQESEIIR